MNGIARTLKHTIGALAIVIALTLAVMPLTQSGLGIRGASAEVSTGDFASRAYFEKFCKTLGGTFDSGTYFSQCVLPDGHIYLCDETGKNCTFWVKRPFNGGVANVSNVNGTLTTTGTGGAGTTAPTGTNRTTNSTLLNTKDR